MKAIKRIVFIHLILIPQLLFTDFCFSAQQNSQLENWKLSDTGVELIESDDTQVFKVSSGKLTWTGQTFLNGIIEYEMKVEGYRSFVYTYFREQNNNAEAIYFRTHKSDAPDALQYSPEFQGRSAWQIYHGKKGTARAFIPSNEWIKVKLEVNNERLSIWLGDEQVQVVDNMILTGDKQLGTVSFRGFIPRGSRASYSAFFRNIKITPKTDSSNPVTNKPDLPDYVLQKVRVSPVFKRKKHLLHKSPISC